MAVFPRVPVSACALVCLLVVPPPLAALTWTQDPPTAMPDIRGYHAAGVIDGRIYVAGGGCFGGTLGNCIVSRRTAAVYDPALEGVSPPWSPITPLARNRTFPASAVAGLENPSGSGNFEDRLYVIGGSDFNDFPFQESLTSIVEYDPVADSWRTLGATIPTNQSLSARTAVVDNLVYIIGGHDAEVLGLTTRVSVFDPNSDTVAPYSGDPLPTARSEGAVAVLGRRIYYFGGWWEVYGQPTALSLVLDLDTGQWSPIAPMPRPTASHAAIALGSFIYVIGGWNGSDQGWPYVYAYDPALDQWVEDSQLNCVQGDFQQTPGRAGLSLHTLPAGAETRIHALGGNAGSGTEVSCHESTTSLAQDITPPIFAGLSTITEPDCPDPCRVDLTWSAATDLETPPVTYNVYRDRDPAFAPSPANLVVEGITDLSYTDTAVVPWDQDPRPYYYIVRAQDSAAPPNEDLNEIRIPVPVFCLQPDRPEDVATRLFVAKTPMQIPLLDWSSYPAPADLGGYPLYRRMEDPVDLYADAPVETLLSPSWQETDPVGGLIFYKVRAATDCLGIESSN